MYTKQDIENFATIFARVEREAKKANNPQIWYAWNESVVNGVDTVNEKGNYNEFLRDNELSSTDCNRADYMRIIAVQTAAFFTTDRQFTDATRKWFRVRDIVG
jgi:hypothetical protein